LKNNIKGDENEIRDGSALATVYKVPDDYSNIQNAINACIDDDAVVIMPGTYYEHDISLGGRKITVSGSNPDDAGVVDG